MQLDKQYQVLLVPMIQKIMDAASSAEKEDLEKSFDNFQVMQEHKFKRMLQKIDELEQDNSQLKNKLHALQNLTENYESKQNLVVQNFQQREEYLQSIIREKQTVHFLLLIMPRKSRTCTRR